MPKYVTRQRKSLLDYLARHPDEDLSARQIAEGLSEQGVSLSAVYRNLSDLETEGKVRRSTHEGSRDAFYRYTDLGECRRHLHLSCKSCGRTFHMDAEASDTLIDHAARDAEFQIDRTDTVLYGLCKTCQNRQQGARA